MKTHETISYMATDQYGNTYHDLKHPRKDLMNQLGSQHVDKMYMDTVSGETHHIGYIIAGHWLNVYSVGTFK